MLDLKETFIRLMLLIELIRTTDSIITTRAIRLFVIFQKLLDIDIENLLKVGELKTSLLLLNIKLSSYQLVNAFLNYYTDAARAVLLLGEGRHAF